MHPTLLQFGSGTFGTMTQVVLAAGSIILLLMLVALGGFAYKTLVGGGIEWPDERDEEETEGDGVQRGGDDDEWDFY